jgi:hypothetical protein
MINSRRMKWAGYVDRKEEKKRLYKDVVGKCEGKRPLGRCTHKWEDN